MEKGDTISSEYCESSYIVEICVNDMSVNEMKKASVKILYQFNDGKGNITFETKCQSI